MTPTAEQWERASVIQNGADQDETILDAPADQGVEIWLALACSLLTSPIKAEREQGKALVREWKKKGAST